MKQWKYQDEPIYFLDAKVKNNLHIKNKVNKFFKKKRRTIFDAPLIIYNEMFVYSAVSDSSSAARKLTRSSAMKFLI